MVPGMTERERLAADIRRAEWLIEAALGSMPFTERAAPAEMQLNQAPHLAVAKAPAIRRWLETVMSRSARTGVGHAGITPNKSGLANARSSPTGLTALRGNPAE